VTTQSQQRGKTTVVNLNDTLNKIGDQKGQAGGIGIDAIVRLFGARDLSALLAVLQSKGLGRQVKSWVSAGQNQQVSGADIKKAADPAVLRSMAKEQELSTDELADHVARSLPHLVDQATPEGIVPQQGAAGAGNGRAGAANGRDSAAKPGAAKPGAARDGAARGAGTAKNGPRK
jgi:uncharacterized protein YidB (DUF937 family)